MYYTTLSKSNTTSAHPPLCHRWNATEVTYKAYNYIINNSLTFRQIWKCYGIFGFVPNEKSRIHEHKAPFRKQLSAQAFDSPCERRLQNQHMGGIQKQKNTAFRGHIPSQEGIKAHPNLKLASLRCILRCLWYRTILCVPFITVELNNKDRIWQLLSVVSLCVNVYFWLTFYTVDVISSDKLVL